MPGSPCSFSIYLIFERYNTPYFDDSSIRFAAIEDLNPTSLLLIGLRVCFGFQKA